ncbi:hypothetical protein BKA62DRAFT_717331 [Auriculariales sp. MPI-PUGE-AT-0066]|nr:hypothetical protein BKA62DRAFT_717331 [Auriculariales sp. MPI-PUGE-AT-0066]
MFSNLSTHHERETSHQVTPSTLSPIRGKRNQPAAKDALARAHRDNNPGRPEPLLSKPRSDRLVVSPRVKGLSGVSASRSGGFQSAPLALNASHRPTLERNGVHAGASSGGRLVRPSPLAGARTFSLPKPVSTARKSGRMLAILQDRLGDTTSRPVTKVEHDFEDGYEPDTEVTRREVRSEGYHSRPSSEYSGRRPTSAPPKGFSRLKKVINFARREQPSPGM